MRVFVATFTFVLAAHVGAAQDVPLFSRDFPPGEFRARREKLFDAIGTNALDKGVEILSDFIPMEMESIESLMKEEGLLQIYDARGRGPATP